MGEMLKKLDCIQLYAWGISFSVLGGTKNVNSTNMWKGFLRDCDAVQPRLPSCFY